MAISKLNNGDLQSTQRQKINGIIDEVATVQSTANGAIQKTGGDFTGEVTFADGIKASNKLSMELLWENASPTSYFGGQTINIDLSSYLFYLVWFGYHLNAAGWCEYTGTFIGAVEGASTIATYGNTGFRDLDAHKKQISFGNCTNNGQMRNDIGIPFKIYGIKGVM